MEIQVSVIGVTGTVGSRVAAKLARQGIQVRGIARDPSRFPGHANVELVIADLTNRQEAEKALRNSHAVYLTPPEMGEDPLALESAVGLNVIEAAKHAGIQHLVLHTALQADRGETGAGISSTTNVISSRRLSPRGLAIPFCAQAGFCKTYSLPKITLNKGCSACPGRPNGALLE